MQLSIVIPVYNPLHLESKVTEFLIPQLEGFNANTDLDHIELVYVCNGCTELTRKTLGKYRTMMPIRIVWIEEAIGFTKATNIGIKASQGDFILLWNDDAILLGFLPKDHWRQWFMRPFSNPGVGLIGIHEIHCPHAETTFLIGYCLMARRTTLEDIGLLDETFSPGAGEDTDICIRARLAGWIVMQLKAEDPRNEGQPLFPIYHLGEMSFHNWDAKNDFKPGSKWDMIYRRNSQLLADRRRSGYYRVRQPMIEAIPKLAPLQVG